MTTASAVLDISPRQALDSLRQGFGLSDYDLAAGLGVSARTLKRWEAGTAYPQLAARQKLARLLLLKERVEDTFEGAEDVRLWCNGPARYLKGMTPAEAIRAGRIDLAEAVLDVFDSGIFL